MMRFDGKWKKEQLEARIKLLEGTLRDIKISLHSPAIPKGHWMRSLGDKAKAALDATPAEAEEGES